jgi:hypothetical protein
MLPQAAASGAPRANPRRTKNGTGRQQALDTHHFGRSETAGRTGATMKRQSFVVVGLAVLVWLNALAQQSVLPKTGVTAKELQDWCTRWISESTAADSVWLVQVTPGPSPAGLPAFRALTSADKLALTQEVLASVKATVMAPGFRAAHTDRIAKQTNRAIDHGIIDPETFGITGNLETDVVTTTVVPMIQMLRTFPDEALRQSFADERTELPQQINDEEGEERAKLQAHLVRLNALVPLVTSNPQEFKLQYTLAKSVLMGGPDTEAKLQAAMSGGADKEKMRQEQISWNKYNLDAILKKNLTQFIDHATRVDFNRATQVKDGYLYWSNGDEMSGLDTLEVTLGQAPTSAAVAFARAWLGELK